MEKKGEEGVRSVEAVDDLLGPILQDLPEGDAPADSDRAVLGALKAATDAEQWDAVIASGSAFLRDKAKHLEVATHVAVAYARRDGFAGIRVALAMLSGLLTKFGKAMQPALDPETEKSWLSVLNDCGRRLQYAARVAPMSPLPTSDNAQQGKTELTLAKWIGRGALDRQTAELARLKASPTATPTDIERAERDVRAEITAGRLSTAAWQQRVSEIPAASFSELLVMLDEVARSHRHALEWLDQGLSSKSSLQEFGVKLTAVLSECAERIGEAAASANQASGTLITQPDLPVNDLQSGNPDSSHAPEPTGDTSRPVLGQGAAAAFPKVLGSRQEALLCLSMAQKYFMSHEPHNPVIYLLEQAQLWATTHLHDWLSTVVTNADARKEILSRLGPIPEPWAPKPAAPK